jgi:hypothetical protein
MKKAVLVRDFAEFPRGTPLQVNWTSQAMHVFIYDSPFTEMDCIVGTKWIAIPQGYLKYEEEK